MNSRYALSALLAALALTGGRNAIAADPPAHPQAVRATGGEAIEFGSFECTATKAEGDKPTWTCPAQTFASKFKEAPAVFFSIAGFENLAVVDGSLSLQIDTQEDVVPTGFKPVVEEHADKPAGMDKSVVRVTWIAVGEGERGRAKPRMSREERLKLREMRQQEKAKNQ